MTRKQLPFFLAFLVLMFGAMACACLGSGAGLSGIAATAKAASTQASGAAATAAAAGNTGLATANAAATEALATANAAGGNTSGATDTPAAAQPTTASGGATDTPAAAQPTTATAGGGSTISGAPSDIPVMDGDKTNVMATAQLVTYGTKSDAATVVTFYKAAMPKAGWTADATTTVESPLATILGFKKDARTALVTITKDPSSGGTVVAIALQ